MLVKYSSVMWSTEGSSHYFNQAAFLLSVEFCVGKKVQRMSLFDFEQ